MDGFAAYVYLLLYWWGNGFLHRSWYSDVFSPAVPTKDKWAAMSPIPTAARE
jgi:hypothetical protein